MAIFCQNPFPAILRRKPLKKVFFAASLISKEHSWFIDFYASSGLESSMDSVQCRGISS